MADDAPSSPGPFLTLPITNANNTTGNVCIAQIQAHLDYYEHERAQLAQNHASSNGPSSLVDLTVQRIIKSLRDDPTPESLEIVLKNTPPTILPKVIQDPSLHYSIFRRWGQTHEIKKDVVDVDEYVFRNERDMRRRPEAEWNRLLVTLDHADGFWPESEMQPDGTRLLKRKMPPREHWAILGEKIQKEIRVHGTTESFKNRFESMTGNILKGLNWDNVFVAGGLPLACLTCVDEETEKKLIGSDIDLYIYGLGPEDANAKAEEIWNVWSDNVGDKPKMVIRNAKTFTFISEYPTRRVQIVLKLIPNPAAVLLNFDLDQCAIGWNGQEVLMLPRCARAVETGYTVFTTDLVYGHYLGDRRASQEMRILKYADRGFGILFPAAILAATEIDFAARGDDHRPWHRRDNPQEPEVVTGKKAVLRLAYLARDTVHRFFIGPTEASLLALEDDDYYEDEDLQTMKEWTPPSEPRGVDFCQLDGEPQYRGGAIGNRNGLKMFESFMRMVAAWTFDVEGKIKLNKESFNPVDYMQGSYDDLPKYDWDASFDLKAYAAKIEDHNNEIFGRVKDRLLDAAGLNMYNHPPMIWRGVLTRRIRRIFTAPTFSEALTKQITIPLWAPRTLSTYISSLTSSIMQTHTLPPTDEFTILVPGHNGTLKTTSNIIPIPPSPLPDGYSFHMWVIGNTTSWARFDRRVDEIFECLWTLYHQQFTIDSMSSDITPPRDSHADDGVADLLKEMFQRRPVPSGTSLAANASPSSSSSSGSTWPDEREKQTWSHWLHQRPYRVYRNYVEDAWHDLYREMFWFVPAQEEWYWDEERDGGSDAGVWGEWRERESNEARREREAEWRERWQRVVPETWGGRLEWERMEERGVKRRRGEEEGVGMAGAGRRDILG